MTETDRSAGWGGPPGPDDGRLDAPAFHRNGPAIAAVLQRVIGHRSGSVLEIGSGSGQHAVAFAKALPRLTWWPSDPVPAHRRSIAAWRRHATIDTVMAPVALDAAATDWGLGRPGMPPSDNLAAIVCINVLHIAPWAVTEGLIGGARRHLAPDGRLIIYGPFARDGAHTASSNADFDRALRRQNPDWGVRDTAAIDEVARRHGLRLDEIIEMPANNVVLVLDVCQQRHA